MRMMISKWIIDRVAQQNPTLKEFVTNYPRLNAAVLASGRNNDENDDENNVYIDLEGYVKLT